MAGWHGTLAAISPHSCVHFSPAQNVTVSWGRSRRRAAAASRWERQRQLVACPASGPCFDTVCQAATDRAFAVAVSVPVLVALVGLVWNWARRPPSDGFEDPTTGAVFVAPGGTLPERDTKGNLAFRPISFTPWPVDEEYEGERLRIPVGPVAATEPRTFVFNRLLPGSDIIQVTLPRPLGVVFEYDERTKRTLVADVVEGSNAAQQVRVSRLGQGGAGQGGGLAVQPGDVLRAVTATNVVYPTRALFGAVAPERHIVVYGADKQSWAGVRGALRKGVAKDGAVTLVLERSRQ